MEAWKRAYFFDHKDTCTFLLLGAVRKNRKRILGSLALIDPLLESKEVSSC
jgi:hypothetical protein